MPDLKRQVVTDFSVASSLSGNEAHLDKLASYFSRKTDKDTVQSAIITAYGTSIGEVKAGDATVETYVNGQFSQEVYSGAIDAITMGWGHKVTEAKATLFTESGSKFSLVHDTKEDVKDVEDALHRNREKGGYETSLAAADRSSVFIGSCGLMVTYFDGSLQYRKINPGQIRTYYGDYILFFDKETKSYRKRPVNTSNIEEASVVMVRLSQISNEKYVWLAIIPRSESPQYPDGRYVTFIDAASFTEIPDPGKKDVYDYTIDGSPANPLSWYANQHSEQDVPEIPISIFVGGTTDDDALLPTCDTLYNLSVSFDKKTSHISDKVDDKAAGTKVFKQTNQGTGKSLPLSTVGNVVLHEGQEIEEVGVDAGPCEIAHNILLDDKVEAAAAFSVPDFMVSSEDHTLDASSGVALAIKAKPLKKDREQRAKLNSGAVDRLFDIEKFYIAYKGEEDESLVNVLVECTQTWDPGKLQLPQNTKELVEEISVAMKDGYMDTIEAIRKYYQFPSDQEAMEFHKKMEERKKEFPPLVQEEKKAGVGFLRGNRGAA